MSKSILFINQSSGYLMIDIVNAHVPYYDNLVLLTGFLNPRETPLDKKVNVKMCKTYDRRSTWSRFNSWFVFWVQSLYYIFMVFRSYKLYFVTNPPINVFSARFLKRPFAFLIYDVYPDALRSYSFIKESSFLYRFWMKTNLKVYRNARKVFTISSGMKKAIAICGLSLDEIDVVPIWTNTGFFKFISKDENIFLKNNKIQNRFIVGYSGNLGISHPIGKLLELARLLKNHENLLFLIIGEGDKKNLLIDYKDKFGLENVKILGYQETDLFPHVLHAMDIGVVTLDSKASSLSVPSKIFNLMSAGKPILGISGKNSELSKLINENGIGRNFSGHNLESMKSFILKLKTNSRFYNGMHDNSYNLSLKYTTENAKRLIL